MLRLSAAALAASVAVIVHVASPATADGGGGGASFHRSGHTVKLYAAAPSGDGSTVQTSYPDGSGGGSSASGSSGSTAEYDPAAAAAYGMTCTLDPTATIGICPGGTQGGGVAKQVAVTTPQPGSVAREAAGELVLPSPEIHMAPQAPLQTYVNLATWLWVPQAQWRTLTKSVTAGPVTVTVVATPARSSWEMGDSHGTSCAEPGRPWVHGMSSDQQTSCSYTYRDVSYDAPQGKFPVTANLVYQVDWTCTGTCLGQRRGTLGEVDGLSSRTAIRVGERQSVVVSGG